MGKQTIMKETFINNLKTKGRDLIITMFFGIIKLYSKITIKNYVRKKHLLLCLVNYLARISSEKYLFIGESQEDDAYFAPVVCALLEINPEDPCSPAFNTSLDKEKIKESTQTTRNNHEKVINEIKQHYIQLSDSFELVKKHSFKEFGFSSYMYKLKKTNAICKEITSKYWKYFKEVREKISSRRSDDARIDFNTVKCLKFVSILFATFALIGGYLYAQVLLNNFSIAAPNYFALSDYTSASLDHLVRAGTFAILTIAASIYFRVERARMPAKKERKWACYLEDASIIFFGIVTLIVGFINNRVGFICIGLAALTIYMLPYLFARYIKVVKITEMFVVLASIIFISYTVIDATNDAINIKNSKNPDQLTKIYFKNKNSFSDYKHLTIITKNSTYYFFFDTDTKKTIIMPVDNISFLEVGGVKKIKKLGYRVSAT